MRTKIEKIIVSILIAMAEGYALSALLNDSLAFVESSEFDILFFIFLIALVALYADKITEILKEHMTHILVATFIMMTGSLLFIVFFTESGGEFATWLGVKSEKKAETVKLIAYGIIGTLAAINAVVINRRARAQEKKNDDYRFQHLVHDLGHEKATVRVTSFNRFYYLASKEKGEKGEKLSKDIFEILCSYLRVMSSSHPYTSKEKYEYLAESQILFDVLFKGKFKSNDPAKPGLIHDKITVDLRNANFADIDFSNANLSNAKFQKAKFTHINFSNANLSNAKFQKAEFNSANLDTAFPVRGANFNDATLDGEKISIQYFPKGAKCRTYDNNIPKGLFEEFEES